MIEKTGDKVSQLLGYCLQNRKDAEKIFSLVAGGNGRVPTEDGEINLDENDRGEFVARYSAEVEPLLWESKRRKDQI